MGFSMAATVDSRLTTFNTLAMHYQDEAYTLAYYCLGDEISAENATQAAFDDLFKHPDYQGEQFRYEMLRRVLEYCRRQMSLQNQPVSRGAMRAAAGSRGGMFRKLMGLKESERWVAVLVDVIGQSYEEAARVLGSSKKQVGKLLAQARVNLGHLDSVHL